MYGSHFGLQEKPFRIAPSPKYMYLSETHDEGRARILYGIRESRGFAVVTGRVGLGKTTVLLSVLDELETEVRTALIFNPVETFEQLLRMICFEFGVETEATDQVELMRDLNQFLVERLAAGDSCVVLIDEAQNLSLPLLEKLRMLNNLQTEEASLLQIVLVGQPELIDKMDDHSLRQLRQRVGVWHEILPLDDDDTREYIFHRLRQAGAARPKDIIPVDVCHRIHELSDGVPRLMNQICDTAMVIAYARSADWVTREHIEEAAGELRIGAPTHRQPTPSRSVDSAPTPMAKPAPAPSTETLEGAAESRVPRSRLALLAVGLVAVILAGTVVGWASRSWNRSGEDPSAATAELPVAPSESSSEVPVEAPDQDSLEDLAETESSTADRVAADRLAEFSRQVQAHVASIERNRQGSLFSVHLGSFEALSEAEDFAANILLSQPDWSEPFFVDTVDGDPTWYRVLAGGFDRSDAARGWVRSLRSSGAVDYAQLTRLPGRAENLSWADERDTR